VNVDSVAGLVCEGFTDVAEEGGEVCIQDGEGFVVVGAEKQEVAHLGVAGGGREGGLAVHDVCKGGELGGTVCRAGRAEPDTRAGYDLIWRVHLGS
jgi:hypothetical protein